MALVNYATREINAKIVYYGPGLSGKTTNIHYVFERIKPKNKGKLISLATQGDRTLFFDFLPVELGNIKGFNTRFHLYTVPGQVFYNSTRKLVLKGADGVVFVADSQKMMMDENLQSMENLKANLADMGLRIDKFPVVIQYNKRDLPNAAPVEEMDEYLNPLGLPYYEASAVTGDGVLKTMTAIVKFIMHDLKQDPEGHDVNFEVFSEQDKAQPETDDAAAPAAALAATASEPAPGSRESVWADELPANVPETAPVPEPAPLVEIAAEPAERPEEVTASLHMAAGWKPDEAGRQSDMTEPDIVDVEPATTPAEGRLDLSGHITLPSGVMDMPVTPSEAAGQETAGTAFNFPPVAPGISGAFAAPEAAHSHDDEEIYEAVEVPDELCDAIKDDVYLPGADLSGAGQMDDNAPEAAPVEFDEQERTLFSELADDVHDRPVEAEHLDDDITAWQAAEQETASKEPDAPDVFAEFAGLPGVQILETGDDVGMHAPGHIVDAEDVTDPIAWEDALHDAEEYVEEAAGTDAAAVTAGALKAEAVPVPDSPSQDLFDVYFGRKASRPSMSVDELDTELAEEFAGHPTEQPVMGSRQVFTIPVRITTSDGHKEVTLKVSVEVELEGAGIDSITKVEVLQPYPKADSKPAAVPADESRLKPPDPVRPARIPAPIPMPKTPDKKFSVLQKILGMK